MAGILDAKRLVHIGPSHQHGAAKGGVPLIKGLAVLVISDKANPSLSLPEHIVDQLGNPHGVFHVELVGGQG